MIGRRARVKKTYDEYAKEKSFHFESGTPRPHPGAALEECARPRHATGQRRGRFLRPAAPQQRAGPEGDQGHDQGDRPTRLASVASNKATAEALATGETTVKDLVKQRFGGTPGPDGAKAGPTPPTRCRDRPNAAARRGAGAGAARRVAGASANRWSPVGRGAVGDRLAGGAPRPRRLRERLVCVSRLRNALREVGGTARAPRRGNQNLRRPTSSTIPFSVTVLSTTAATSSNTVAWATTRRAIRRSSTVRPSRRSRRALT